MNVIGNSGTIVASLLLPSLLVIAVYDIVAGSSSGRLETVTDVIRGWSARWPILPFAAGLVAGYLFW